MVEVHNSGSTLAYDIQVRVEKNDDAQTIKSIEIAVPIGVCVLLAVVIITVILLRRRFKSGKSGSDIELQVGEEGSSYAPMDYLVNMDGGSGGGSREYRNIPISKSGKI